MQQIFQISFAQSLSLFSIYCSGDIAYIEVENLTREFPVNVGICLLRRKDLQWCIMETLFTRVGGKKWVYDFPVIRLIRQLTKNSKGLKLI